MHAANDTDSSDTSYWINISVTAEAGDFPDFLEKLLDHRIRRPNLSCSMYNFCVAITAVNRLFLSKNRIFTMKKFVIFGDLGAGVKNLWTKVPKGTPSRQNWSNKSFGICASSGVLMLYGAEIKSTGDRPLKS